MLNSRGFRGLGLMAILASLPAPLLRGVNRASDALDLVRPRRGTSTAHNRVSRGGGIVMGVLWDSARRGTYVRAKHGELR